VTRAALLFPGQGSQHVGMASELFDARPDLLGENADEVLGWSLRDLVLDGPEEQLTRTEHAQPALFAVSYALWDVLGSRWDAEIVGAAGHSLGEFTALCAAGAFTFEDGLKVVARRGQAMAEAADARPSGMAALIGADEELAESIARQRREEGGSLQVANINAPGQIVVAGSAEDIAWLTDRGSELGVRRIIPLKVAGAFHSTFMEPAADQVAAALEEVTLSQPAFPVWSNTTARPHRRDEIASLLRSQVVSTVRFSESLEGLAAQGADTFVHVGPGDVTAGMAKRTVEGATTHVVSDLGDVEIVVSALGTMT
jgi:[acyl-carrier-protein] S-malonyltransferase